MTTSAKAIGAAASSLILLGSAALAAAPAVMDITADASPAAATQQATEASAAAEATGVQRVEGQFSYDQGVVTSNETIASVFAKAAATLCQTTAGHQRVGRVFADHGGHSGRDGRGGGRRFLCARLLLRLERPRRRRHRQCRGVGRVLGLAYDHGRRLKQGRRSSSSVGAASRLPSQQGRTRDLESLSLAPRILVYLVQDSGRDSRRGLGIPWRSSCSANCDAVISGWLAHLRRTMALVGLDAMSKGVAMIRQKDQLSPAENERKSSRIYA